MCVGLSVLCLIVVAITIGYKSETHYRLDNGAGGRKRIRLIKASSNESSSSSEDATSTDDQRSASNEDINTNMKLGSWFTSKHPVQTLDRKKAKMVYPSAVYLDNLETGNDTPVKATNRSEALTDEENFEDDLNHRTTTSRAQITRKVTLTDNNSVSSLDTIKSEEALDPKRPRNSSESTSETAALTQKDSLAITSSSSNYKKNGHGSYKVSSPSKAKKEASANNTKHKYLSHKSAGPPVKAILDGGSQISRTSSREGSFRFLEHEEIEHTPNAKKPQHKTVGDDTCSIQLSNNSDRLI